LYKNLHSQIKYKNADSMRLGYLILYADLSLTT